MGMACSSVHFRHSSTSNKIRNHRIKKLLTVSVEHFWNEIVADSFNFVASDVHSVQCRRLGKNRAIGVNSNNADSGNLFFENFGCSSNSSTSSSSGNENVYFTVSLFNKLSSSAVVMRIGVVLVRVLVGNPRVWDGLNKFSSKNH